MEYSTSTFAMIFILKANFHFQTISFGFGNNFLWFKRPHFYSPFSNSKCITKLLISYFPNFFFFFFLNNRPESIQWQRDTKKLGKYFILHPLLEFHNTRYHIKESYITGFYQVCFKML